MLTAKDIMAEEVITVSPDSTVETLARVLMKNRISGVPVVNDAGELVGIVTESDLIRKNARLHSPTVIRLFDAYIMLGSDKLEEEIRKMSATTVDEICKKEVVSIEEGTTMEEIASIMAEQHIHLLPVLKDGKVVGIVGKADVIRSMTNETP